MRGFVGIHLYKELNCNKNNKPDNNKLNEDIKPKTIATNKTPLGILNYYFKNTLLEELFL